MMLQQIIQAARQGISPTQFFQQYAGNPQIAQMAQIVQGKSPEQLMQTAENMAKQRGTTLDALAQQMGIPLNRRG